MLRSRSSPVDAERRAWLHELYVEHADVVFRYAASRCGREAAQDVLAETFVEAATSAGAFDADRGSSQAWLLGIATNRIRRRRRDESAHLDQLTERRGGTDAALDGLADRLDAAALAPTLAAAINALGPAERSAFLLQAIGGLTPAEVATALDISPSAARVRLHRARTRLRDALTPTLQETA